jgi:hypothetical protein
MDKAKQRRYEQVLEVFGKNPNRPSQQLMTAICLTQLGEYPDALRFYGQAIHNFLENRQSWHGSSQPNWLVDTLNLANQPNLHLKVLEEVEGYKLDPRGQSLVALYAYALMCLILGKDEETSKYVVGLGKKPKIRDTFAMGETIKAIIERNQAAFDVALNDLVEAHRRLVKFGGLRETPEGFLCLPAMSLSKIALERGLEINVESEYLSRGYLDYLFQK